MVKNMRNAFQQGMQEEVRPLTDVYDPAPTEPDAGDGGAKSEPPRNRRPRVRLSKRFRTRRLGSDLTEENWRAWVLYCAENDIPRNVALNIAFEQCFAQGQLDTTLRDKYEEEY